MVWRDWNRCWVVGCDRPALSIGVCRRCWKGLLDAERAAIWWAHNSPLWPNLGPGEGARLVGGAPNEGTTLHHLEVLLATQAATSALSRRWQAGQWSPGKPRRSR